MRAALAAGGLMVAAAVAAQPTPQPQPPAQTPSPRQAQPPLSERQQDRVAKQDRLIACNKQAREAGLRAGQRQEFTRDCAKGDSAAGGGRER